MLKSRDIPLPTKVHIVKAMVFPIIMYGCESWTIIKKAECWRIDAFELWCWRRLLRVPWTARRSNQSIPKGNQSVLNIHRKHCTLDFQYNTIKDCAILWPPDAKSDWLKKMLGNSNAGKDWRQEDKRTMEDEMVGWHQWLNGHGFEQALRVGDRQESLACCSPWGHKELDWATEQNWICICQYHAFNLSLLSYYCPLVTVSFVLTRNQSYMKENYYEIFIL